MSSSLHGNGHTLHMLLLWSRAAEYMLPEAQCLLFQLLLLLLLLLLARICWGVLSWQRQWVHVLLIVLELLMCPLQLLPLCGHERCHWLLLLHAWQLSYGFMPMHRVRCHMHIPSSLLLVA